MYRAHVYSSFSFGDKFIFPIKIHVQKGQGLLSVNVKKMIMKKE